MSAALEALVEEIRKANAHQIGRLDLEPMILAIRIVYRGMRRKGYSEKKAVESAAEFYQSQCRRLGGAWITDGQHR